MADKTLKVIALNSGESVIYQPGIRAGQAYRCEKITFMTASVIDDGITYPASSYVLYGPSIDKVRDFLNEVKECNNG